MSVKNRFIQHRNGCWCLCDRSKFSNLVEHVGTSAGNGVRDSAISKYLRSSSEQVQNHHSIKPTIGDVVCVCVMCKMRAIAGPCVWHCAAQAEVIIRQLQFGSLPAERCQQNKALSPTRFSWSSHFRGFAISPLNPLAFLHRYDKSSCRNAFFCLLLLVIGT